MFRLLSAAGLAAVIACAATAADAPSIKKQYVNFTGFNVQFNPPSSASAKDPPREVELHISSDQGVTWELAGKAKPSDKKVAFRASRDGEYWFMPRTKYASGRYLPQGKPAPEMKIVVDTTPPVVDLDAQNDDGGEVEIRWHVVDANLKPDSFKLEYKTATLDGKWQKISIDPVDASAPADELGGDATVVLLIREQTADIIVRAEVQDEAGNRTVKEQRLVARQSRLAGSPGADEGDAPPSMPEPQSYPTTETPDWPGEESSIVDDASGRPPEGGRSQHEFLNASSKSRIQRLRDFPEVTPTEKLAREKVDPPPGVHPRLINKSKFELFYDVDAIGSSGIVEVELWITSDGGRNWTSYGVDKDCRSPMTVNVGEEGLYGFRVVLETTAGLRGPSPVADDLPDIWVGVDLTKPEARLISAVQGEGEEADRLVISWQASDEHLAARGISMRWSESPDGPWTTIASGLENSGRYAWRLDQRLPPRVYLLLEARDEAGNTATDQLAEPISLERIRPQGHIRDVRPLQ